MATTLDTWSCVIRFFFDETRFLQKNLRTLDGGVR